MNCNRYFHLNTKEFATKEIPFHAFLAVNLILIDPSITASSFRGRGASYGPTLPDKESVVYIAPRVIAVTIAPQNKSNTTIFCAANL